MPRLVFVPRYLKMKSARQLKNYVNYIATRENAETFSPTQSEMKATEEQKKWIENELKNNPELKSSCHLEYEDYKKSPTTENASELISKIAEEQISVSENIKNYVGYLAKRPRAERNEQDHALWNGSEKIIDLAKVSKEASEHKGNIWTFVVSLKREDAERLGFNNANAWRELVKEKSAEIAEAMRIPLKNFVWYGAFHNEGHHPHIHLMCYSKNPREGYLSKDSFMNLRSSFAAEIFRDELYHIYEQKDEVRNELKAYFDAKLKQAMAMENSDNPKAEILLWELSKRLKTAKHKKVYGRLDKENKILVDEIVSEISKDKKIDALYQSWIDLKDDILSTYQNSARAKRNLADEPEFRNIKNMVLKSALELLEMNKVTSVDMEENNNKTVNSKEKREEQVRKFYPIQIRQHFLLLLKNISRIIQEDYSRKSKNIALSDKKLLRKTMEKKEALGQKM